MSRYQYNQQHGEKTYTIVVGYDRPLQTFFAQVWPEGGEVPGTDPLSWSGADGVSVSLDALHKQLAPYGGLPPNIEGQLKIDELLSKFRPF